MSDDPFPSEPDLARLDASPVEPEIRHIAKILLPVFYEDLKHIAHRARSRLGGNHTLQTTALVHEAFLRLGPSRGFANETHFLRAAALAMRHALINYAEARVAEPHEADALREFDVYVFADTGHPEDGADISILLTGRTLADIGLTNFV